MTVILGTWSVLSQRHECTETTHTSFQKNPAVPHELDRDPPPPRNKGAGMWGAFQPGGGGRGRRLLLKHGRSPWHFLHRAGCWSSPCFATCWHLQNSSGRRRQRWLSIKRHASSRPSRAPTPSWFRGARTCKTNTSQPLPSSGNRVGSPLQVWGAF